MLALPFKNSSYPVTRKRMAEMLQQNSESLMQFSVKSSHYINRDRESSPTFSESSLLVDDMNCKCTLFKLKNEHAEKGNEIIRFCVSSFKSSRW